MNLKEKIEKKLKEEKIAHEFIPLPENLAMDISSHVKFHGIEMKDAVPTIIYKTEKGLIGAQRRADTKIDTQKLKVVAGVKQLSIATSEDLSSIGTEVGLVPLVGLDIPYYFDTKILELIKAYGGGGHKEFALMMRPKDVVKVNRAKVGEFSHIEKSKQMMASGHQRLLSGITPSGDGSLHIGNYLGAVRQFIELAKTPSVGSGQANEIYLMVADLHGLTTIQNKKQLQHNIETLILNELALLRGFLTEAEFNKIVFFRQSDVQMHTECQSILNNITPLGLLKRAHAYKDKLQKDMLEDDVNVGLFSYPMLMAADILLYQPDLVPVGKDQKQHIEITRDIAERFNKIYGGPSTLRDDSGQAGSGNKSRAIFKLPEPFIPEEVALILGTDGQRKMSKSLGNLIALFESEEVIRKQVMGTYTDPTRKHATDPGHIEGNMVFTYLDFFGDPQKVSTLKDQYKKGTIGDVVVKEYLFESLMKFFGPARKSFEELKANPKLVTDILKKGQERALVMATATMNNVRDAIGVTTQYSFFTYAGVKKEQNDKVSIEEFARMEIRVGKVLEAKNKEGSDRLIRLAVDIGESNPRIIFTGVRSFGYTPENFRGKQFFFITNLVYRKMLDEESQGMILAASNAAGTVEDKPLFISAEGMPVGAKIR